MKTQKQIELKTEIEHLMRFCKNNPEARDRLNKISSLIEESREEYQLEVEEMIENIKNPYPEDIFPSLELDKYETNMINHFLKTNFHFPLDRLSADLMRRARETLKEELIQKLKELK